MADDMLGARKIVWNEETEKKFDKLFDGYDEDKNGKLTFDELRNAHMKQFLRILGQNPTDSEIKKQMDKMDKNGDGEVSREEFKSYFKEVIQILQDPEKQLQGALEVMFRACDTDENGLISKKEFASFMAKNGRPMSEAEINMIFTTVDMDNDTANLTKEELLKVMIIGRECKRQQLQKQK